ncbi:PLP-dependent aminotransferase family protein [Dyadobacter sp. CY312]|uniref:aminotransferase-like domain-containing protein n=1 Tax=Dyadobacter sp. CY312 TaxID=2907303 RepID=UPI001F3A7B92|nr:PLP-dependent aminotransferase family protein [Dyadobacter sp. CY312]MCE7038798.1 PLP-dependent aminotransferase family protein [Dyadobacter sp. CY312]
MSPLSSLITIERTDRQSVYLQISNQIMVFIKDGILPADHRLPSTRELAGLLGVHRKTVVQAYDELLAQGWLESHTGRGTFVAANLPILKPSGIGSQPFTNGLKTAGFSLNPASYTERPIMSYGQGLHLDDGFPDVRLAPLEELSRAYRGQLLTGNAYTRLGYGDTKGSIWLRQQLSAYLNTSRGLHTTPENILIVRGTIMGLYLSSNGLISKGDSVVTGVTTWAGANTNFAQAGAKIHTIPVDEYGIDVDALESLCQNVKIRMVYVTSHHHYPTTVALRADRRMKLLKLAGQFGFVIFEDDYDYDFHYLSKPLLPLAGADPKGMVLYCGSFTKSIAPAFRVGYLVGAENVIDRFAGIRRIIDRQGDVVLENAIAELLQTGVIQRHMRKSLRTYRSRRDFFCELLGSELSQHITFQVPDGGLAVWAKFDKSVDMKAMSENAFRKGLGMSNGLGHGLPAGENFTRLGFASSNFQELEASVQILKGLLS